MEYISLHGCIRNTPSDTEVNAERQLTVDRRTCPAERNIWKTHQDEGTRRGNGSVSRTGPALGGWGTEAGV